MGNFVAHGLEEPFVHILQYLWGSLLVIQRVILSPPSAVPSVIVPFPSRVTDHNICRMTGACFLMKSISAAST